MNQYRRFRQVTLAVVLLSIAVYCVAAGDVGLALIALPGAAGAWWFRTRSVAARVPRLMLNLALLAAILYIAMLTLRRGIVLDRVAELMAILSVIKCFDRTSARDYVELYILSVFLVIATVMTSVRLEVGLILIVYVPVLVVGVMQLQIYAAHERALIASRRRAPPWARPLRPKRAVGHGVSVQFRATATALVLSGVTVAIAVFVLIPREIGENFLHTAAGSPRGMRTSFTGEIQLGRAGLLTESLTPVLHVAVSNDAGENLGGPAIVYYLRGNVLGSYDAATGAWTRRQDSGPARSWRVQADAWHQLTGATGQLLRQEITLLGAGDQQTYVFNVYRTARIRFDRTVILDSRSDERIVIPDHRGELKYEVESFIQAPRAEEDGRLREVSFPSLVVRTLTESVLAPAQIPTAGDQRDRLTDRQAVIAIRDFLHTQFTYTTDIQAPPTGQDPIEWFLEDHREGHCEYFASAMAAMCRSIGIEARIVTGYVAMEWNETSGQYVVRERNAHAWVEVRDRSGVYRTYDPTPPDDLRAVHEPQRGLRARLRSLMDAMEHLWVSRVVTFDSGMRDTLMQDGGGFESTLFKSARALVGRTQLAGLSLLVQAVFVGTLVCLVVIAVGIFVRAVVAKRARRRRPGAGAAGAESSPDAPWLERTDFYDRLLRLFTARGCPKPMHRPPLTHVDLIKDANPDLAGGAERLVSLFYRARFGRRPISADEHRAAIRLVSRLEPGADIEPYVREVARS
ncbi:MAG: DUF3488 domain-containing protein [Planctomycetes bacterium]|nr:DUF3488 domain-containing protein [Planctomycetota bacterium]